MKRIVVLTIILTIVLGAYELGTDNWNRYTIFNPQKRALGMTYPKSWIMPDKLLQHPQYEDSSKTFANWEQIIAYGGSGLSNLIKVYYIPYSTPHRWSVGMDFISYKGPNPTDRSDVFFDYRHNRGSIKAFHTNNTQTLNLTDNTLKHKINNKSINFEHRLGKKILLSGGLDYQLIEQKEAGADSIARYDANHQFIKGAYLVSKPLQIYGVFERRHFLNDGRQNTQMVFRPGIRYKKGIFSAHLAARIAPIKFFPIAQLSLTPKPFFFNVYAKVRNPLFIIRQPANQYIGVNTGIDHQTERHKLNAHIEFTYDHTGVSAENPMSILPPNFYMFNTSAKYRLNLKKVELYLQADYTEDFDYEHNYYHPEKALFKSGLTFHGKMAKGSLLLDGDINAQYIVHDDPDSVSFDAVSLTYDVLSNAPTVGSWKLYFKLKATIKDFSISAIVSSPINLDRDINWHLYQGIYTSSDLIVGNTFYAGLTIEWLWWK